MRSRGSVGFGLGLALASAAAFGTSGVFARSLTDAGWTPGAAVAVRVGVAALLLAVPAAIVLRGRWHVARRGLRAMGAFGLLAVGGAQVGFFYAVQYLPVGVALLLEYSGIVLVVLWMWVVHGQRPRRLTVAGATVAVAGLALVLDVTGGARLDPVGVMWGLIAAVGLAAYFVLSSGVDEELPSIALACGGMAIGALVLIALGVTGLLPMEATFGDVVLAGATMSWIVPIAGVVLVAAVFAYVTGIGAARILGAHLASFAGLTEVLFAVLVAWVALDELPTAVQGLGGVCIVGGIALVRLDGIRGERALERAVPAAPVLATDAPAGAEAADRAPAGAVAGTDAGRIA